MAIFKIMKPGTNFYGIAYNEKKVKEDIADRVFLQNFGYLAETSYTKEDLKAYLRKWSAKNTRIRNVQFHAAISGKGQEDSFETLQVKALEVMKRLGYGDNPIVMYEHRDTENNHIHIITSRVDKNGKKINDFNERYRALEHLQQIEQQSRNKSFHSIKEGFLKYKFSNANQFNLLFERSGFEVKKIDESTFHYESKKISETGTISMDEILTRANQKTQQSEISRIRAVIGKYQQRNDDLQLFHTEKAGLQNKLTVELHKKLGLEFAFFQKPGTDKPYGYVLIDHKKKAVYKGSEILKLEKFLKENEKIKEETANSRKIQSTFAKNKSVESNDFKASKEGIKTEETNVFEEIINATKFENEKAESTEPHSLKRYKNGKKKKGFGY